MDESEVTDLNERFGLPGVLRLEQGDDGLARAEVTTAACEATVFLQGAHITHWRPHGHAPVLFLSDESEFAPGKAIRGGIPVCFPWFGARSDGGKGPSHGFARISEWDVAFAALVPGAQPALHLTLTLGPNDLSRPLGFDHFRVAYELTLGTSLGLKLTIANLGETPLVFEEALHTYFSVGDVRETVITGLEAAPYLDKTDHLAAKINPAGPLTLTAYTDRVFNKSPGAVQADDRRNRRQITCCKTHSATTVLWNPWPEGSATLSDLPPDAWPHFICIEAANAGTDAITLLPNQAHSMQAHITVEHT